VKRIDQYFLLLAAILLIGGVGLGIFMAMNKDYQLAPVHAHVNLVGWVSLAIFGLTYRAFPRLKDTRLAGLHFALAAAAAAAMPYALYRAIVLQSEALAIVASVAFLAAAIIFLIQLVGIVRDQPD
jgi:hypothetical protein